MTDKSVYNFQGSGIYKILILMSDEFSNPSKAIKKGWLDVTVYIEIRN